MALAAVTVRSVARLSPGETIWDAGHKAAVKGFGVRRQRGDPVYVVKFRVLGHQRFITIGHHGSPWTPEKARHEAKRLLGLAAAGKDPQAAKAQARAQAADTLGRVVELYLAHAVKQLRPRSYRETERYLLVNWKPLHSVSVFHLTRRQVAERLRLIASPVTAARARAALSAMFNWAIREGYEIRANPVSATNRPPEPKPRSRVLTDVELAKILSASGDDDFGRIVKLLMLTAQRRDEVGAMQWSEIRDGIWTIPASRTKNHREQIVPLSDSALAIIDAVPRRNDRDFIFGNGAAAGFQGWSKSKRALDARISLPDWRLHDLRRTAATMMAELGVLPHIIEAVLNHVSGHKGGVAGVYNRAKYSDEMRTALQRWADHLDKITA